MAEITFPWPPKQLSPNFKRKHHWTKYAPHSRSYRKLCWCLTLEAIGARPNLPQEELQIAIHFTPPDKRRRDRDGIIGMFKAGQDGMCDALGLDDYYLATNYTFYPPSMPGCVRVVFNHCKNG